MSDIAPSNDPATPEPPEEAKPKRRKPEAAPESDLTRTPTGTVGDDGHWRPN